MVSTLCCLAVLLFFFQYWGAHKSLAPTACTLLSVLGHATISFAVFDALVFVVFGACPTIFDLDKQGRKFLGGFMRSEKTIFPFIFCWLCVFFLIF